MGRRTDSSPRLPAYWNGSYTDHLEADMCKELENGRLVRLMAKLGFINERPE